MYVWTCVGTIYVNIYMWNIHAIGKRIKIRTRLFPFKTFSMFVEEVMGVELDEEGLQLRVGNIFLNVFLCDFRLSYLKNVPLKSCLFVLNDCS